RLQAVPAGAGQRLRRCRHATHWLEDKTMTISSIFSETRPQTGADAFADKPFNFTTKHGSTGIHAIGNGVEAPLVRIETLIAMKEQARRDRDRGELIDQRWILHEQGSGDKP